MSQTPGDERLFELVLYLISSARLTLDETPIYGSLRLIEGASRLIEAAPELGDLDVEEFVAAGRESIEANKLKMINDHEGYRDWLTGFLSDFAAEAARRNLGEPGDDQSA